MAVLKRIVGAVTASLSVHRRPQVTAVLTSCGRFDLLVRTLNSFYRFNTYDITKLIVVEDGPAIPEHVRLMFGGRRIEWLHTGNRVGQIAAIDYAYSRVTDPYIFHLEDDWEFYRRGFIEHSLAVLKAEPQCLQVWIRGLDDTNGHPVLDRTHSTGRTTWRRLAFDYKGVWHGFSFNPGLRRLSDYHRVGTYGSHAKFDPAMAYTAELRLSGLYRDMGYFAAIVAEAEGRGFVRHIGDERHVEKDGGLILMYHKIDVIAPTKWWVTAAAFREQMESLRAAGKKLVRLDEYSPLDPRHVVVTFDDAYENVFRYAFPVLRDFGYPFEVFCIGDCIGGYNWFDTTSEPLARFADMAQLQEMAAGGATIQWHTRTHARLPELSLHQLEEELTVGSHLRASLPANSFRWFSYPYGMHTPRIVERAKETFAGALACEDGLPQDRFRFRRTAVDAQWRLLDPDRSAAI